MREWAVPALVIGAGVVVMLVGLVVLTGASVATLLGGGAWVWPQVRGAAAAVWGLLSHPDDPAAAFGPPFAAVLTGRPTLYWITTGVVFLLVAAVITQLTMFGWRQWGPTPPGHATRAQVRAELSLPACRRAAAVTRPSLSAVQRRGAEPEQIGVPLPQGPIGMLWAPLENPTGTLAPTQSGKSRRLLVHYCLAAPGALLCSTSKPDLLLMTALARTRRLGAGRVLVFDATATLWWPGRLRWSPISGCENPQVAERRARTMVEAAAVAVEAGGGGGAGNDRVFRERAVQVVASYLIAAALCEGGVGTLLGWALTRDDAAAAALEHHHPDRAANLRAEQAMVAETSDAVWMSVRRVLEPFLDPTLRELCSPAPGQDLDLRELIAEGGSLYLVAGQREAAGAVPVLTALAEEWLNTAREMALQRHGERLDPPATAVLDELPNATPIPGLPAIVSDSAGRGVLIHWAAQSKAQLDDTFGRTRAAMLLDNTTLMAVWGGLKDASTLDWLSTILGHYDRDRWQTHTDGFWSPGRDSLGTETVPTYRAGEIRTIPRFHVLIVHRAIKAVRARTLDVSQRRDWSQLRADIAAIRGKQLDTVIDAHGLPVADRHRR